MRVSVEDLRILLSGFFFDYLNSTIVLVIKIGFNLVIDTCFGLSSVVLKFYLILDAVCKISVQMNFFGSRSGF